MNGQGEFIFDKNTKYKGDYKNNKRDGKGTYTAGNIYYTGQWLNNIPHGEGKIFVDDKNMASGIFRYGKLVCLIEYDGQQHYEFVKFFHKTQSGFKKQQEWDRRKNKYCLLHNIPLYRVPYWQLEDLTLEKIFSSINRVKDKYHIDNIKRSGVKK